MLFFNWATGTATNTHSNTRTHTHAHSFGSSKKADGMYNARRPQYKNNENKLYSHALHSHKEPNEGKMQRHKNCGKKRRVEKWYTGETTNKTVLVARAPYTERGLSCLFATRINTTNKNPREYDWLHFIGKPYNKLLFAVPFPSAPHHHIYELWREVWMYVVPSAQKYSRPLCLLAPALRFGLLCVKRRSFWTHCISFVSGSA